MYDQVMTMIVMMMNVTRMLIMMTRAPGASGAGTEATRLSGEDGGTRCRLRPR